MRRTILLPLVGICLAGCGGSTSGGGGTTVAGKATFVLGASSVTRAPASVRTGERLTPGTGYLVSPNKAKITFTSIAFRDASGGTIATSALTNCIVTYDRSGVSGTSLLDCPFDVPVATIAQISVGFSTTVKVLLNDTATGIYSHPGTSVFTTTQGTPDFTDVLVTAGASATERSTPVIFSAPVTVAAGSSPQLFITTDMIHGLQLQVDGSGTSLSPSSGSQDPVALFGGFTKGSSSYYSDDTTIESVQVAGKHSLRIFYDDQGHPLFLMSPYCDNSGMNTPKGAWATPPLGATIGGWLGKDSGGTISWALPSDTTYASYNAYFVMPEKTTVGQATQMQCKVTASPPPPADGKTYASGAPALTAATTTLTLNLLAK